MERGRRVRLADGDRERGLAGLGERRLFGDLHDQRIGARPLFLGRGPADLAGDWVERQACRCLVLEGVADGCSIRIAAPQLEDEGSSLIQRLRAWLADGGRVVPFLHGDADDAGTGKGGGTIIGDLKREVEDAWTLLFGGDPRDEPGLWVDRGPGGDDAGERPGQVLGGDIGIVGRGGEVEERPFANRGRRKVGNNGGPVHLVHLNRDAERGRPGRGAGIGGTDGDGEQTGALDFGGGPGQEAGVRLDVDAGRRVGPEGEVDRLSGVRVGGHDLDRPGRSLGNGLRRDRRESG